MILDHQILSSLFRTLCNASPDVSPFGLQTILDCLSLVFMCLSMSICINPIWASAHVLSLHTCITYTSSSSVKHPHRPLTANLPITPPHHHTTYMCDLLFFILFCCPSCYVIMHTLQDGMLVLLVILICAAHVLKHNTTLSRLELWNCGLRDEDICELCGGLKWCKLKTMNLHGNPFGDQGAKGLADVLKDHPTLEELGVYGCDKMSDDGMQYLMDAMMSNTRVKMLSLSVKYRHLVRQQLLGRIKFDYF